ncbi:MAG TPA: M1 family aminopeptidase [Thermoanaerobaculia bacterium]|nr:M1 family aminopeptidase [Thermoanaerobaculia bacterium]
MRLEYGLALGLLLAVPAFAQDGPPPVPAAPISAPSPGAPYRDTVLSGRTTNAAGLSFTVGAARYEVATGSLWEVTTKDGTPVGAFFRGAGTLAFSAGDPQAARLAARNAKHVGGAKEVDGELRAAFSRATFLFSPALRPAWSYAAGEEPPVRVFATHLERFEHDRTPQVASRLAIAEAAQGAFFAATLEADPDLRHVYDPVTDDEEVLRVVDRPAGLPTGFPEMRFARDLSRRPLGRTRRQAPRVDVRLVAVDVDVREGTAPWGELKVTETFVAVRPVSFLVLDFATETIYRNDLLETRLRALTDGEGRPLPWALGDGELVVALPKALAPGARFTLRLDYEAPYFERAGGDNLWELPIASGWYPQPPFFNASHHTFHAVVRARKPLLPFASGDTVRRSEEDGWNVLETRLERPVPFATVLAGKYTTQESTEDGVTCRVASYGIPKEMSGKMLLSVFHGVRKFYEWLLGPFPWKEFTIVEINAYGFGQAPPGMMRITKEAFQSSIFTDEISSLFSHGINQRVAHEIAHAYFGYVVADASPQHQWISEAFSEIASMYAIEKLKGKAEGKKLAGTWAGAARHSAKAAPIDLANDLAPKIASTWDSSTAIDRAELVYSKGAHLLQTLRLELGDDLFFTVLRSFLRSFEKQRDVTTDDFVALLSFATKKDWKPWFEKYYYGTEMP